ncbi:hypothetical protein T484DRAFT_1808758 [Baffinella frigidus]|nr:hypothetical protein T484DRAFT_1808758 [Cryptophyta sp. CCMP2293]
MDAANESAAMLDTPDTGGGGEGEVEMGEVGVQEVQPAAQHAGESFQQDESFQQEDTAGTPGEGYSGMDVTGGDDSIATGGDESCDAAPLLDSSGMMGEGEADLSVDANPAVDALPDTPGGSGAAQASPQGEAGHDKEGGTAGMSRFGRKRTVLNFARMIDPLAGRSQSTEVKEPRQTVPAAVDEFQAAATQASLPPRTAQILAGF